MELSLQPPVAFSQPLQHFLYSGVVFFFVSAEVVFPVQQNCGTGEENAAVLAAAKWSCIESSIASLMHTRFTLTSQDGPVLQVSPARCTLCMLSKNTQSPAERALLLRMWGRKKVPQLCFVELLLSNAFTWERTETVRVQSPQTLFALPHSWTVLRKGAVLLFSHCPATRKACSPSRVCVRVCDSEWRLVRERAFHPLCWNMRVPYTYRMVVVVFRRNCSAVVHGCQQHVVHRVPAQRVDGRNGLSLVEETKIYTQHRKLYRGHPRLCRQHRVITM